MLTYNHMLSVTPSDVRSRSKKVSAVVTKAEAITRGKKKGVRFSARGKAATEKIAYETIVELYPEKISEKNGIAKFEEVGANVDCFVHCTCPFFLFHAKWVLWKYGSSDIKLSPPCDNMAPAVTNPEHTPYVCKHLFKIMPLSLKALVNIAKTK